jgi:hypothetical protein
MTMKKMGMLAMKLASDWGQGLIPAEYTRFADMPQICLPDLGLTIGAH